MASDPVKSRRKKLIDVAGYAALAIVVGPFALLYLSAFLGLPIMNVPGFPLWLMSVLTIGAAFCLYEVIAEGIRYRRVPLFWMIGFGGMAYLCGSYICKTLSGWF